MPSSNLALAPTILALAHSVQPRRVLDIGPGNGKYGLLLREYVARDLHIAAAEAEPRYLAAFPWLACIYDEVIPRAGEDLTPAELNQFDLVLMIDVLEHLSVRDGIDLLERIPGRVIICTPREWFQNPEADAGWETERHRSLWSAEGIAAIRPLEAHDIAADLQNGGVLVMTAPLT